MREVCIMADNQRISVSSAADELGMAPYTVRYLMEQGKLPIGHVIRSGGRGLTNRYLIFRPLLDKYLGRATE